MLEVVAAVIRSEQRVLIARRSPEKSMGGKWEFPGGKVEPGESHETALRREIEEEFGVDIEVGELILSQPYSYPELTINLTAYWATTNMVIESSTDHDLLEWVAKGDLDTYDLAEADRPVIAAIHGLCIRGDI